MGWFSGKKKIMVSSVVYNLAGGPEDRIKYLPSVIATKVISNTQFSMSETLQNSLVNGPGMRMRRFARWARISGYSEEIGLTVGSISAGVPLDLNIILPELDTPPGQTAVIQDAYIGEADYAAWADQWMLQNHPDQVAGDYIVDYKELTNTIIISFADSEVVYEFSPVDFDMNAQYLYVGYTFVTKNVAGPVEEGSLVPVAELPPIDGWQYNGQVITPMSVDLVTTTVTEITYSDSTPPETSTETTTEPHAYNDISREYEKTDYLGMNPEGTQTSSLRQIMYQFDTGSVTSSETTSSSEETLPGDVIKTTTVTTTTEAVERTYAYRIDTQTIADNTWSTRQTLIYKKGSGNAVFDGLFIPTAASAAFFPFIPLRLNNNFIDANYLPEIYELNKKAMKRAMDSKYDNLITSIAANDSIGDVDHAYISFGVTFNTKEDSSKKYIYKFFQTMRQNAGGGEGEFNAWRIQWNIADTSQRAWLSWKEAQSNPASPLYGEPEPTRIGYPVTPTTRLKVQSSWLNYDMWITWTTISETTGTGQAWPGAKVGEIQIVPGATESYEELLVSGGLTEWVPNDIDFVTLTWQDGVDTWRSIGVWNLVHDNLIYRGKAVTIGGREALNDPEESGFIIPMHEGIFRGMSLKDTCQMSMASSYVVFNCYQVVKQKWYQTDWFKIVLVIIVIVITVLTAGSGAGAGAGLLGTAAGVGAALGFAGTIAIIVGTIANAIAAMLLTQLLTMGATALFGEQVGAIVGAIASIIAINVGTGMQTGMSMSASISAMGTAENLLRLTVAAGKGISGYMADAAKATMGETEDLMAEYSQAQSEISKLWEDTLGYGKTAIDPTALTEAAAVIPESANVFLNRTLMTGSDIAALTNSMITNFAALTTSTTLPG